MRTYQDQPSGTVDELRRLRREAPAPERQLLRALKESFPHLKWRHQTPVGPFKPDILCFLEKLIIEVDGDTHTATGKQDANRTCFLRREGYRVLRFTNADVMGNIDGVIATISLSLWEREGPHSPQASGKGEDELWKSEPATAGSPSPFRRASAAPSLSQGERER
ncbi:endonuclease domain-containing protein [Sphingomonas bacterium]|uniref:endonuclease domain-containing protein n=1 Tax=Sphingomonas bacterium TaxID=1895847 RepID=UPI001576F6DE|nr:DUF559 domain-containing protein [Sphingomonas bacterium]